MPDPPGPDRGAPLSGPLSPSQPLAWSKVVDASTSAHGAEKLSPSLSEGSFSLRIPTHITEAAAASRDLSLVGTLMGPRPPLEDIKKWARLKWQPCGALEIAAMPNGFILFSFSLKEDFARALLGGPWFFGRR
ncbi:hypothetical protein KI387_030442, partial [Taxus chinensis]